MVGKYLFRYIFSILFPFIFVATGYGQPIVHTMYTLHKNTLKITAQLRTQTNGSLLSGTLEVQEAGIWVQKASGNIINPGWTLPLRVETWDDTKDWPFRVVYNGTYHTGVIRKNPIDKDTLVVAVFTGNGVTAQAGGNLSKQDVVDNVKALTPDLLVFTGDQVYNHNDHFNHWIQFGVDFGDLMRDIPTITIPDDHDVGMANLWGASGKVSNKGAGTDGGYFKPLAYVLEVERAQTSHLPDPYDPTPIQRGIGVYYTSLNWGGVGFAIVEDRKFKSGVEGNVPYSGGRWDLIYEGDGVDPKDTDFPQGSLLGQRQLDFLKAWGQDWKGVDMKATISATIFAMAQTHTGNLNQYLIGDYDANGWPMTGRNKALREIRKSFSFMMAGDQHLSTVIHHGVDTWNDAGVSFAVPSIANIWRRWWQPKTPGANREPGAPDYTGEFLDGFGNHMTMMATANPRLTTTAEGPLGDYMPGFGIVKFNKKDRTITMENWPRNVDVRDPNTNQFPGWPITIKQEDNYGRKAVEYLPTLKITGQEDAVVQVINEKNNEVEYTLRINENEFTPKVFESGLYTVKVGEAPNVFEKNNITAIKDSGSQVIDVGFKNGVNVQKELDKNIKQEIIWNQGLKILELTLRPYDDYLIDVYHPNGKMAISRSIKGYGKFYLTIPYLTSGMYLISVRSKLFKKTKKIKIIDNI